MLKFGDTVLSASVKNTSPTLINKHADTSNGPYFLPENTKQYFERDHVHTELSEQFPLSFFELYYHWEW